MKTRFMFVFRAFVFVFVMLALAGVSYAQFAGGDGSEANPYLVTNAEQLSLVRSHLNSHFVQTAAIDLNTAPYNAGLGWLPIGTIETPFTGSFYGNGLVISGLYINRPGSSYTGLFGYVSQAEIQHILLTGVNIVGGDYTGALAGSLDSSVVSQSSSSGFVTGANICGGLFGSLERSSYISVCKAEGEVNGQTKVGGLVGNSKGNSEISASVANCEVIGSSSIGGLVGLQSASLSTNSYSTGLVSGTSSVGGLLGVNDYLGVINYCYSTNQVLGSSYVGGLIGRSILAQTNSSYWDMQTSGTSVSAGGLGRNSSEMRYPFAANTYEGWNFAGFWAVTGDHSFNNGYPYLSWEYSIPTVIDLAIIDFSGPAYIGIGVDSRFAVSISNYGNTPQESYVVKLLNSEGQELDVQSGAMLSPGDTLQVEFNWIPGETYTGSVQAVIEITDDSQPANNLSSFLPVQVFNNYLAATLGSGNETARVPIDMYWRNSLYEVVIPASELGFVGAIYQLDWYNNFVSNLPNIATRIWLGETAMDDLSLGWIPSTDLQEVFDGAVNYPSGQNTIAISLDTPYNYQGGNLVMMVQRPMDAYYFSSSDVFYCQTEGSYRAWKLYSDTTVFDPANPPTTGSLSGQYPKMTLHLFGATSIEPPVNLVVDYSVGNDWLTLNWDAPPSGTPLHYNVYRDGLLLANTTMSSYQDTELLHGASHTYRVSAVYAAGESVLSNIAEISITLRPLPALVISPVNEELILGLQPVFTWENDDNPLHPAPDGYEFLLWSDTEPNIISTVFEAGQFSYSLLDVLGTGTQFYWKVTPFIEVADRAANASLNTSSEATRSFLYALDCPVWSFSTYHASALSFIPDSLDFGDLEVGQTAQRQITIFNGGTYPTVITALEFPEDTNWSSNLSQFTLPYLLNPGDEIDINIQFHPLEAVNASLVLNVVDAVGADYTALISGRSHFEAIANPINLVATVEDWQNVSLTWQMEARNGYESTDKQQIGELATTQADSRALQYFEVYRNSALLAQTNELEFFDNALADGYYEYYVVAVYNSTVSQPSNTEGVIIDTVFPPALVTAEVVGDSVAIAITSSVPGRELGYSVWRLQTGQESEETLWTAIAESQATMLLYDTAWASLPDGDYKWAVKAVYPGAMLSGASFTNELYKEPPYPLISVTPTQVSFNLSTADTLNIQVTINNTGSAELMWDSQLINNRNLYLSFYPSNGLMAPGSSQICTLTIQSLTNQIGSYDYELVINSNDPYNPMLTIPISGVVFSPLAYIPDDNFRMAINEALGQGPDYMPTIADLNGISGPLYAYSRNIISIEGAQHLTNLQVIHLLTNQISDLSPMANLTNLQKLSLDGNQISDLSPLANLTNLHELYLDGNQIRDLSPLANLTNLQYLYLDYNEVSNLSPIANLTNLQDLNLDFNQISDLSPLANLTNLSWLYLDYNQISDLTPLANLSNLQDLFISSNQFSDLSPLVNLTNLQRLGLDNNQISDLTPLANLTNLQALSLVGNLISDLNPLVNLTNLYSLYLGLGSNPISYESMLLTQSWSLPYVTTNFNALSPCYPNPDRDAQGIPVNTNLIWEANYDSQTAVYELYLGTNRSELVYQGTGIAGSNFHYGLFTSLQPNTQYFWRVKAVAYPDTIWSGLWSFTTGDLPEFAGGSGTESDPYQVATAEHLNNVRNHLDAHFIQISDIDLGVSPWNEGEGWVPIGDETSPFTGVYHAFRSIENLYIDRYADNQGLFGYIDGAEISGLFVDAVEITGANNVGGIVGKVQSSFIINCSTQGILQASSAIVGGIVGNAQPYTTIEQCSFNGTTSGSYGGGIAGTISNGGIVRNCYSTGTSTGGNAVGGIVGINYGGTIEKCIASGSVNCSQIAGGIVGISYWSGAVNNCYSSSPVFGDTNIGGIAGFLDTNASMLNCYSTGSVSGVSATGGLIGGVNGTYIFNSYWNTETSGQLTSAAGEGRTTAEMTSPYAANTYVGWDWESTWAADLEHSVNSGYPYLQWMAPAPQFYPPQHVNAALNADHIDVYWQIPLTGAPVSYQVWRLQPGQELEEGSWTLVSGMVADTLVTDPQWQYLEDGSYKWAVKAFYGGGNYSISAYSNAVYKQVIVTETYTLYVNGPDGYAVSGPVSGTTNYVATDSDDMFNNLLGTYTIASAPAGYHWAANPIEVVEGNFSGNTATIEFVLVEDIAYDYPEGDTVVITPEISIVIVGGDANSVTVPIGTPGPYPNPGGVPIYTETLQMIGAGPWTITYVTTAPVGIWYSYTSGSWNSAYNVGNQITFVIPVGAKDVPEVPIALGDDTLINPPVADISVTPEYISHTMEDDSYSPIIVTIQNNGMADLDWSSVIAQTQRRESNGQADSPQSNPTRDLQIDFAPSSGIVAASSSSTCYLVITTSDVLPGLYTYSLTINSNDPDSPSLVVPIDLTVTQPGNAAPVVSNVHATQRDDASMMMDIYYDVYDADYDSLTISLKVSDDDGATWNVACTMIQSGSDIGNQIYSGTGKHIVWDVASEHPNILGNSFRFKVIADDQKAMPIPANFVRVEGGTFNNGTSDVTLSSFYIDKYELTQADYQAVMGTNPSYFAGNPNRPVEQVSWFNAIEYCNRRSIQEGLIPCYSYLSYGTNPDNWPTGWNATNANHTDVNCNWSVSGYRLPTEAEWEFAARGGNLSMGYTYSGSNNVNDVAWWGYGWGGTSGSATNEVGTIGANELHLFDFSGNVFEWVWDIMGEYPSIPQSNPTGSLVGTNRVSRGGNWGNPEYYCQVAYRYNYVPISSSLGQGFRICRRIVLGTVSTPVFSPMPGVYTTAQSVTISCTTPGATIRYTLDGSEPTEMSSIYVSPILVSVDTTIKAIAYKDSWLPSPISAATYTIQSSMPANFVFVEGGTFNNGTSDVTLSSFYIDKYELTQADYQAVMGANPSYFAGNPNFPVELVSWFNAIEYCNRRSIQEGLTPCYSYSTYGTNPATWPVGWNTSDTNHTNVACNWTANGYRLPTEMEWMFAARGGNQTHNYTYSGSSDINAVAWYSSNSGNTTHTVGTKTANELGIYDMSGNIFEWCWDIIGSYPSGLQTNPTGASSGSARVRRGGSWGHYANYCTVSDRSSAGATISNGNIGFRCVRVSP